ncbi:MAG: AAA family ATPase [Acidobacteriia bacterium]|nr:AAA family ATPase [Terriglobia bacterium]
MLLDSITLKDLLSFQEATIELRPLNVLIGPNASGKSNLISAITLLKAAPGDLQEAIRRGGGVRQWIGKRQPRTTAAIEARIAVPGDARPLEYSLAFTERASSFHIVNESLRPVVDHPGSGFLKRSAGHVRIYRTGNQAFSEAAIAESKSGLAAYRDPADPTPITRVGEALGAIQVFREFHTDLNSTVRTGVSTMAHKDFLWEGGGNLALILDDLRFAGKLEPLKEYLRRFWEEADDVRVKTDGPVTQTYVKERGIEEPISAIRLSDGTLKFLCLLAALRDDTLSGAGERSLRRCGGHSGLRTRGGRRDRLQPATVRRSGRMAGALSSG